MAAKKTNYYYVLVFTENGPVYVTKFSNANKTAWWNKDEKPLAMTKSNAEDFGFRMGEFRGREDLLDELLALLDDANISNSNV